jgi:hypothetical protein
VAPQLISTKGRHIVTVTAGNLVQGPATIYVGDFGAVEPADSAVASAPSDAVWTDAGGTTDGLKITIDQKYSALDVDQLVEVVESRLTAREVTIETKLAEATLDNLKLLMNGGSSSSGSGYESLEFAEGSSATQPDYSALIIDGWGPNGKRRRVIIRKVLQIDAVALEYKKDGQTVYTLKMRSHYVSSAVKSIHIVDEVEAGS